MGQLTNNGLAITSGILLLILIGTGAYTYSLYSDVQETEKQLLSQKKQVMNDLDKMVLQYETVIAENQVTNESLIEAKERIQRLIDSLSDSKSSIRSLFQYKKRYLKLQDEMDALLKENDRLKLENKLLAVSLDSTKVQLQERVVFTDSLVSQNSRLSTAVKDASAIQTVGLKGLGVIERNNGKQIPTERARRSDKLKICFTIAKNSLASSGDKSFYVQVIDPKNNVLGDNKQATFEGKVLNYTLVSSFDYQKKNLDICEYVNKPKKEKFEKGLYYVNIFNKDKLISTSNFSLK